MTLLLQVGLHVHVTRHWHAVCCLDVVGVADEVLHERRVDACIRGWGALQLRHQTGVHGLAVCEMHAFAYDRLID